MAVGIPNFPTSLDAASDLVEATNNASTTINMVGGLSNSATTITVVSTAAFPSTGIIRIDDELISYSAKTSTTFTVQTRGFESTTAASHIDGATVSLDITAASNNAKNTAIIALETKVGTGSSTPTANTVLRGTGTGTSAFGQVGLTTDVTGTLPAANGGTGITSLGSGVATFLGTPSSANLASAVTNETGSGALVFGTSPSLTTPAIGSGGFTLTGSGGSGTTTIVTSASGSGTVVIPSVSTATTETLAFDSGSRPFRNVLINGDMAISQRNGTTNTSTSNNTYALDRWYVLTQTAAVQVQQLTLGEDGTPFYSRLTQNQSTAQRMGYAQVIEGDNCQYMRGQPVTLSFRVRHSLSAPIRYAVLEWSGTKDVLSTSRDVVNSWTNTTFTTGQFFKSTNFNVTTSALTPTANTWTTASLGIGNVGSTFNNLIVFIWTENTTVQNATLDISRVQLQIGPRATEFEYLPIDVQLVRCQRYYYRLFPNSVSRSLSVGGQAYTTRLGLVNVPLPFNFRDRPSAVLTSGTAADYTLLNAAVDRLAAASVPSYEAFTTSRIAMLTVDVGSNGGLVAGNSTTLVLSATSGNGWLAWDVEL